VQVKAKIFTIGGFSGHAGQSELLGWVRNFKDTNMKIFLVHGEGKAQRALQELLKKELGLESYIPDYLEEVVLESDSIVEKTTHAELARPSVDWDFLVKDSNNLYAELQERVKRMSDRRWEDQTDFRDRLMEINRQMVELISEM
jgi:metallo-beta-lactamase family protein